MSLIPATLIRRYKRFLADMRLETGEEITAHCANPGAMLGLNFPGAQCWLSRSDDAKRKLKYSWELVEVDGAMVGINTSHPNKLVWEALQQGKIPHFQEYHSFRREVKYGQNSRIDILAQGQDKADCFIEIKNVHLMRQKALAEFPDCVTERGRKHLHELAEMAKQGQRAVMLYVVQRTDCENFSLARDLDAAYGQSFDEAMKSGVEAYVYACDINTQYIVIGRELKIV